MFSIQGETKLEDRKEQYDEVGSSDKVIIATYGVAPSWYKHSKNF